MAPIPVHASGDEGIMPLWEGIITAGLDFSFEGTSGEIVANATKKAAATSIEGRLVLYKYVNGDWVYQQEWNNSSSRGSFGIDAYFTGTSGYDYKAEFTVTAYLSSGTESHTMTSIKTCP